MNTTTICTDLSRFPSDLSTLREATRANFAAYVAAHDLEAPNEGALPLLESVPAVRFVENPLDVLDLLGEHRADNCLVRETVMAFLDGTFEETGELWTLELAPYHDQTLLVVAPEAALLVRGQLRNAGGAGTPMGSVERFALAERNAPSEVSL